MIFGFDCRLKENTQAVEVFLHYVLKYDKGFRNMKKSRRQVLFGIVVRKKFDKRDDDGLGGEGECVKCNRWSFSLGSNCLSPLRLGRESD